MKTLVAGFGKSMLFVITNYRDCKGGEYHLFRPSQLGIDLK